MNKELTKPIHILLIEDNSGDARMIQEELKDVQELSYTLDHVTHLQQGLDYAAQHDIDVILADLSLPDSPGLETFKRLQTQASKIPVVVLTGFDNESMALDAVREGAQDYLIKGQVDGRTLSRTILYAIERHRSQSSLRSLSLTDELTKLYNRRGFMTLGEQSLKAAVRVNSPLVLFGIDLDGLKQINDTYGHPEGDRAIAGAAEVLKKSFRQADVVARIGGDEYAVLAGLDQTGGHEILLSRLRGNLAQYNLQNGEAHRIGLSVGHAIFDPARPCSISDLMAAADHELYADKNKKKGLFYSRNGKKKWALLLLLLLLGLNGWLWWKLLQKRPESVPVQTVIVVTPAPAPPVRKLDAKPKPPVAAAKPVPPPLEIHPELIPKNVAIARFTYKSPLHSPGENFEFDIVGSGFTAAFQKAVTVYSGSPHVQVKNLRLVTINQIHGEMVIHATAPTGYAFPYVLLNEVPVFKASAPFAVIRPGEVLDIVFARMDPDGKGGHFRTYMNLDDSLAGRFSVRSDMSGVEVSPLTFKLPYMAEGNVRIAPEVPRGEYPLSACIDQGEVFRKDHLIQVIHASIGRNGFIQAVRPADPYVRPGDPVTFIVQGRGFEEQDASGMVLRMAGVADIPVQYAAPDRMEATLVLPVNAVPGIYDVHLAKNSEIIFPAAKALTVVGRNWLRRLDVTPSPRPGFNVVLTLYGKDLDPEYAKTLRITCDEPGLHILRPVWVDAHTLRADMQVDSSVKPGSYLVNVSSDGKIIAPAEKPILTVLPL